MSGIELTSVLAGVLSRSAETLGRQRGPIRTLAQDLHRTLAGQDPSSLNPAEVAARLRPLLAHDDRLMRNANIRLLATVGSDHSPNFLRRTQKGWVLLRAESLKESRRLVAHLADHWLEVVNITPSAISPSVIASPSDSLLFSRVFPSARDVLAHEGFGDIQLDRIQLDGQKDIGFMIYGKKLDPPVIALPDMAIWDRPFQQCGIGAAVLLQLIDYAHRTGYDFWITSVVNPQPFHRFLLAEGFTGSVHIGPNLNNPDCFRRVQAGAPEIDQVTPFNRFDSSPWPINISSAEELSRLTRSVVRIEIPA